MLVATVLFALSDYFVIIYTVADVPNLRFRVLTEVLSGCLWSLWSNVRTVLG